MINYYFEREFSTHITIHYLTKNKSNLSFVACLSIKPL
jgi:hypothetical protein